MDCQGKGDLHASRLDDVGTPASSWQANWLVKLVFMQDVMPPTTLTKRNPAAGCMICISPAPLRYLRLNVMHLTGRFVMHVIL